ncbi:MAG: hypothetical protein JW749_02310 [Sedimentisphaerales bacterium]|nr:hypothetical protein [Sedimentisphaerales bacterium]
MKTRIRILPIIIISGLIVFAKELVACPNPPPPPPAIPIAILSGSPDATFIGNAINLDGHLSQHLCWSFSRFDWDFHYDGSFDAERYTGDFPFTSYSYSTPGTYTIALRVQNYPCGYYSDITSQCLFTVTIIDGIFVDKNATGTNDGSSWTDAFNYLQDALEAATDGDQIWVAEGIYRPDENSEYPEGTGLRTSTFQLPEGVTIYGGFPTGGGPLSSRNWVDNETILSGAIGVEGTNNDNCYNVVSTSFGTSDVIIDGFTIAGGYADVWGGAGAGMSNGGDNITIANCIFRNNFAWSYGGGIYNTGNIKTITNCAFIENETSRGGGISNYATIQTINSCTFNRNYALNHGGGIFNDEDIPIIINCVFCKNETGISSQGIYHHWPGPSIAIINCTFNTSVHWSSGWAITAGNATISNSILRGMEYEEPGASPISGYNLTVNNSCIQYYVPGVYWDGGNNNGEDPQFVNPNDPEGPDDIPGTTDDGLRVGLNSPCINTGNNNSVPPETIKDIKSYARFNDVAVDMGAYEYGDLDINQDSDSDGMPDWFEFRYNLDPENDGDAGLDGDLDGLLNLGEYVAGTDPTNPDTDDDDMLDGYEVENGLNPLVDDGSGDLDGDGLTNWQEYYLGTEANNPDSDGDDLSDGAEISMGTNPLDSDTDDDNLSDGEEILIGTDPKDPDTDNDNILDGDEVSGGTNPNDWDMDDDLLPDGWEIQYGLSPFVADDISSDTDGDGLHLLGELKFRTNPNNADTDGDGTNDGAEVTQGSYPAYATDLGLAPSADEMCSLQLTVGDHSGSHSERYDMVIYRAGETSPFVIHHQGPQFGVVTSAVYNQFRAGERYEIKIIWLGTNNLSGEPDYDYVAYVNPGSIPAGVIFIEEDPEDILTYDYHNQYPENLARCPMDQFWPQWPYEKKAYVNLVKPDLKIYNGGNNSSQGALVPDADEENIGAYLLVNCDDDDNDDVPDLYESGSGYQDNDLARLDLFGIPAGLNEGTVELIKTSGSIKLWQNQNKTAEQTVLSWNLATTSPPVTLWIEGIGRSTTERDIEFELRYTRGTDVSSDSVRMTVVMINLGNAVYRALDLFGIGDLSVGHAGVVVDYTGACTPEDLSNSENFWIIEMPGPSELALSTFTDVPYLPPFGCYSWGLEYSDRLRIVKTAKALRDQAPITYVFFEFLSPSNWNDILASINGLRCDALTEVCYEINDKMVWGKIVDGSTHYDIRIDSYQEEHKIGALELFQWKRHLAPATQCGYGNFEGYREVYWQTTFYPQNLCQPIGHTGEN